MHFLVTSKNEVPIKKKIIFLSLKFDFVLANFIYQFVRHSSTANSIIGDGILQKLKLNQAFMVALDSCKNEDLIKIKA